jgi:Sulfotransferase domain
LSKDPVFIVASLPRTGTTSLCAMAKICGLKPMHVLEGLLEKAIDEGYDFFSDTPFYIPEFLCGVLESSNREIKLIYSHRNKKDWLASMETLKKIWIPTEILDKQTLIDDLCYKYMETNSSIEKHHEYIRQISEKYDIEMLDYKFGDGWEPFCRFIDKHIPDCKIPHLNLGTAKPFKEYYEEPQ